MGWQKVMRGCREGWKI